ncbi:MAG: ATP-binding protein [Nitrospinota bacterium]|nr:ATP-binding protein [Nitrospinota bacterium]
MPEWREKNYFVILIWLGAAIALAGVALIAVNLNQSVQEEGELAFRKNLKFLCESTQKSAELFVENVIVEVVFLTQLDAVKNYRLTAAAAVFRDTLFHERYKKIISHLILLDGEGEMRIAVSTTPEAQDLDKQVKALKPQIKRFFAATMKSYLVNVSGKLITSGAYRAVGVGMPIPRQLAEPGPDDAGSLFVSGVVMALVNADELASYLVGKMRIEKSGFAWMAMNDGKILGDRQRLAEFASQVYGPKADLGQLEADFAAALKGKPAGPFKPVGSSGREMTVDIGEQRWFLSYSPFKVMDQKWVVAALAPRSEVTHLLERSFEQSTMMVLSVALILVISGSLLTRVNRRLAKAQEKARMAAELEEKNRSLADMNRRMDEFVAVVSHDIRSPLNVVKGFVQLIRSSPGGGGFERETSVMLRSCERMMQLTRDILDISKLEAGKVELAYDPVVIDNIILESAQIMEFAIREKKIETRLELGQSTPMEGDSGKLLQVMNNLIGNAVKFTPAGGAIVIAKSVVDESVLITVSDTGPGIPEDEKGMVFSKFEQVKTSQQGVEPGYGLGLTICKSIIELHGGSISLASKPGEGATFHVKLPIKKPASRTKIITEGRSGFAVT